MPSGATIAHFKPTRNKNDTDRERYRRFYPFWPLSNRITGTNIPDRDPSLTFTCRPSMTDLSIPLTESSRLSNPEDSQVGIVSIRPSFIDRSWPLQFAFW